jgi:hypothetical protein
MRGGDSLDISISRLLCGVSAVQSSDLSGNPSAVLEVVIPVKGCPIFDFDPELQFDAPVAGPQPVACRCLSDPETLSPPPIPVPFLDVSVDTAWSPSWLTNPEHPSLSASDSHEQVAPCPSC